MFVPACEHLDEVIACALTFGDPLGELVGVDAHAERLQLLEQRAAGVVVHPDDATARDEDPGRSGLGPQEHVAAARVRERLAQHHARSVPRRGTTLSKNLAGERGPHAEGLPRSRLEEYVVGASSLRVERLLPRVGREQRHDIRTSRLQRAEERVAARPRNEGDRRHSPTLRQRAQRATFIATAEEAFRFDTSPLELLTPIGELASVGFHQQESDVGVGLGWNRRVRCLDVRFTTGRVQGVPAMAAAQAWLRGRFRSASPRLRHAYGRARGPGCGPPGLVV